MARFRRGNLNWMTQPRGLDGRFQRRGNDDDNHLLDMNGFWKLPWWGMLLFVAGVGAAIVWMTEHWAFIGAALAFPVLIAADKALDALLPDREDEDDPQDIDDI